MIQAFDIEQANEWDTIVRSFAEYDVYYLSGYVKAFQIHGDGMPKLLYYKSDKLRAIYVLMKRDISQIPIFNKLIKSDTYYDSVTPYGYGGVLFDGEIDNTNLNKFKEEFVSFMQSEKIIDDFVRYHPILQNANNMRSISNVIDLGETISMDLTSEEEIWSNITSKNRNMIRKAQKNGVEIRHGKEMNLFNEFIKIYNSTMENDNANEYYYFKQPFYNSIHDDLYNNYELFYALYNGEIIAMSIILFANKQVHYHLSGSIYEYRKLAPTNLLLYEVARWGCQQGYTSFHLGGGVGSGEDNLFKFKREFNRNSNNQFSIGKQIFDQEKYNEIVDIRKNIDKTFDMDSSYFPLYRS